jgi:hypothetical protein
MAILAKVLIGQDWEGFFLVPWMILHGAVIRNNKKLDGIYRNFDQIYYCGREKLCEIKVINRINHKSDFYYFLSILIMSSDDS